MNDSQKAVLVLEVLQAAFELMQDPEKICVNVRATDAQGKEISAWKNEATCFCSLGAIDHQVARIMKNEAPDSVLEDELCQLAVFYLFQSLPTRFIKQLYANDALKQLYANDAQYRSGDVADFHDITAFRYRDTFLNCWGQAVKLAAMAI